LRFAEAGDAVIVMGAGDIWREAHELADRVRKSATPPAAGKGARN
jgi:hypothetical protein